MPYNLSNFSKMKLFTFSSEKVLDLCKMGPPRFCQMSTFWDPLNPKIEVSQKCLPVCLFACLPACLSVSLSVCLSVYTITFERIDRLDWNLVHLFSVKKWRSSSLANHFWPTVLVLSIKNGFYKIKKSIFRPNYSRYEKMLRSKIVHLKETYKFYFNRAVLSELRAERAIRMCERSEQIFSIITTKKVSW